MVLPKRILKSILPFFLLQQAQAQASGSGTTTRYWDCCKASCGWSGKLTLASGSNPVASCDINDNPLTDYNVQSGCNGGSAYMCTDQTPWAVSDSLSYGFAATTISGGSESSWCCACYQLTFTSGAVAGKQMIVQATNTGGDLGSNQFDIAVGSPRPPIAPLLSRTLNPLPPLLSASRLKSNKIRCPAAVSESSTAAPPSGAPPAAAGARNTAASPRVRSATLSLTSSRPAATGASTGSRTPTTQP